MLRNHLITAVRNLRRHPGYTAIHVLGLGVGMASCLVIAAFVQHETSFDRFHENADRIYRVAVDRSVRGQELQSAVTRPRLAGALVENFPELEAATRLFREISGGISVRHDDRGFVEDGVLYADSNFFDVFSFQVLQGDPETALARPFTILLTESAAEKYFGQENPLGQTLILRVPPDRDEFGYTVTGIMEDVPANSHFAFDFLASYSTQRVSPATLSFAPYTYLRLRPDAPAETFEAKLRTLAAKSAGPQVQEEFGATFGQFDASGSRYLYFLQPLTSIHLHSHLNDELQPNQSALVVFLFALIAGFILLLAGINFVNLATARAARRATEVGIRKTFGSKKGQLVRQFLTESMLMSGIAILLAVAAVGAAAPWLSTLTGRAGGIPDVSPWILGAGLLGLTVLVGALAGSYPAFYLASLRPAAVLKGEFRGQNRSRLRDALVVVQFTVSIALVAGALVVSHQMHFLLNRALGYDPEAVVIIEGAEVTLGHAPSPASRAEAFREALRALPDVLSVTNSEKVPGRRFDRVTFQIEGEPEEASRPLAYTYVAFDFVETLGLSVLKGRSLSRNRPGDSLAVMLNQTAVRHLGIRNPIGQRLVWPGQATYEIIGVVEDFHIASLHDPIQPVALLGPDPRNTNRPNMLVSARIRTEDLPNTLASLEQIWRRFAPQQPFAYSFLEQDVAAFYEAERRTSRLITLFTGIALVLACCGLFGLAAHAAEERTKEIGIRKALGASSTSIFTLLSKDFVRLVLIAVVVAAPISYFAMSRWLESFAFRVEMGLGVFVVAGLVALVIAVATVSYQTVRAALADPVKSLRYE